MNIIDQIQREERRDRVLELWALEYHRRCERFDQSACRERRGGIAFPVNRDERVMIDSNARRVASDIFVRHLSNWCSQNEWSSARKHAAMEFERLLRAGEIDFSHSNEPPRPPIEQMLSIDYAKNQKAS